MQHYRRLPFTLYRIQSRLPVTLRDFDKQREMGRDSYDLKLFDGLVKPIKQGTEFERPNGMSLRPPTNKMIEILVNFKGTPTIYRLLSGLELPPHLILYHEHTDHYSLQTSEPVTLDEFNGRLTEFLQTLPSLSRKQFLWEFFDEDDQDN